MARYAKHLLALALVGAGFGLLYRHVVAKLVHDWGTDDNYSHGFLIVPIALYFAWERRDKLASAVHRTSLAGLVLVVASVAVLGAGVLGAELFLTRISMLGVIAGAILFIYGWQHLRILAFPLAFLLLMIPIPAIIFNQIAFPLQLLASRFGEVVLTIAGVPVLREGNVITLSNTSLEVAEACSGIRSLDLAADAGHRLRLPASTGGAGRASPSRSRRSRWPSSRTAIRVAGTGLAAHFVGPEAAQGFFHEFSGWLVFVVAFVLLFAVQRAIAWLAPDRAREPAAAAGARPPRRSSHASRAR